MPDEEPEWVEKCRCRAQSLAVLVAGTPAKKRKFLLRLIESRLKELTWADGDPLPIDCIEEAVSLQMQFIRETLVIIDRDGESRGGTA